MGSRIDPVNGLIAFDEQFVTPAYLAPVGAGTQDSTYTQAGSQPGFVTAVTGRRLVPVVSNEQGSDVDLYVNTGGMAGALAMSYSLDGGTTYRGWDEPLSVRGFVPVVWTDTDDFSLLDACVIPSTQKVVLVYAEFGTGNTFCKTYNGTTWSAASTVATTASRAISVVVTPDESKLICFTVNTSSGIDTWYSTDDGATWALNGLVVQDTTVPTVCDKLRACFIGNDICLMASEQTGTDCYQYASSDLGATVQFIGTFASGDVLDIAPLRDNAEAVCAFIESGVAAVRHIGSAWDPVADATSIELDGSTAISDLAICVDHDNTVYVFGRGTVLLDTNFAWTSTDRGETWSTPTLWYDSGDNSNFISRIKAVSANGDITVLGQHSANPGNEDGSISAWRLSQWSNIELNAEPSNVWACTEVPSDQGTSWAAGGATAGTITADGYLDITTVAANGWYTYTHSGTSLTPGVEFTCKVVAGGDSDLGQINTRLTANSAAATYQVSVRMDTTSFKVYDVVANTEEAAVTVDLTTDMTFRVWFDITSSVYVAYKRPHEHLWTMALSDTAFTDSGVGGAAWTFIMGHTTATTSQSKWRYAVLYNTAVGIKDAKTEYDGKTLNALPYPLADAGTDDGAAFLSVRGGPAYRAEEYEVPAQYRYGIRNVFPAQSPSPVVEWHSENTSEQVIAFDLGRRTWLGGALALLLLNVNFRTAVLEAWNGAAWTTLATYDGATGFTGLTYALVGDTVTPDTGTLDGGRYVGENEFAGGFIDFGAFTRPIVSNSGGNWTDDTTAATKFVFDDVTGTEAASGTCDLVAKNGLLIAYPGSEVKQQYWRVRIPTQDCPDDHFKAGLIGVGRVMPFGQPWGWGWTQEDRPNYESYVNKRGTEIRRQLGDSVRAWTFDFADGINQLDLRGNRSPDYVGVAGGVALAAKDSVWPMLRGMLSRTKSYSRPVVAVSALPTSSTTLTDPSVFLYGYMSGSVGASIVGGVDGSSEVVRIEKLTVEEVI